MPLDKEQPSFALEINDEAQRTIQGKLMSSGVAGLLSLVPGVGGAVTEMMTELAIQRTNERMKELFEYFVNEIRDIGEDKVDRDWFRGEEFQSLLYEALQQLHVTKDRQKIEMLGVALANSGTTGFKEDERKDLFIRFVRDLTAQHIRMLLELAPRPLRTFRPPNTNPADDETPHWLQWNQRPIVTPKDEDALALQMLHAYGLVEETLASSVQEPRLSSRPTEDEIRGAIRQFVKQLKQPTTRSFQLSQLGQDFLGFVGLPKGPPNTE